MPLTSVGSGCMYIRPEHSTLVSFEYTCRKSFGGCPEMDTKRATRHIASLCRLLTIGFFQAYQEIW